MDDSIECNKDRNYCYDPDDPCAGFACGGAGAGTCVEDNGLPSCVCEDGYDNETFELYCCPMDGSDPNCQE